MNDKPSASYRPLVISLAQEVLLNASVPVACYYLSKAYISQSELTALVFATVFPVLRSIFDLTRRGGINPVSVLVMLGIATSIIALFLSGDRRHPLIASRLLSVPNQTGAGLSSAFAKRRPLRSQGLRSTSGFAQGGT